MMGLDGKSARRADDDANPSARPCAAVERAAAALSELGMTNRSRR
jgi:hypothetical protein